MIQTLIEVFTISGAKYLLVCSRDIKGLVHVNENKYENYTIMNCTPTQFNLSYFHYEPKAKGKTKEDRIKAFKQRLSAKVNKVDPNYTKYPKWLRIEFFKYWTALDNDFGYKMKFEKCKSWNTLLRLETWRKNSSKDPRWQKTETYKQPKKEKINYSPINYEAKRANVDQPIGEIMGAGSRVKRGWDS